MALSCAPVRATFVSSATFQNSVQVASILSTGAATLQSSLEVTGAAQIGGTAGITGNATLAGSLNVAKATTIILGGHHKRSGHSKLLPDGSQQCPHRTGPDGHYGHTDFVPGS